MGGGGSICKLSIFFIVRSCRSNYLGRIGRYSFEKPDPFFVVDIGEIMIAGILNI